MPQGSLYSIDSGQTEIIGLDAGQVVAEAPWTTWASLDLAGGYSCSDLAPPSSCLLIQQVQQSSVCYLTCIPSTSMKVCLLTRDHASAAQLSNFVPQISQSLALDGA